MSSIPPPPTSTSTMVKTEDHHQSTSTLFEPLPVGHQNSSTFTRGDDDNDRGKIKNEHELVSDPNVNVSEETMEALSHARNPLEQLAIMSDLIMSGRDDAIRTALSPEDEQEEDGLVKEVKEETITKKQQLPSRSSSPLLPPFSRLEASAPEETPQYYNTQQQQPTLPPLHQPIPRILAPQPMYPLMIHPLTRPLSRPLTPPSTQFVHYHPTPATTPTPTPPPPPHPPSQTLTPPPSSYHLMVPGPGREQPRTMQRRPSHSRSQSHSHLPIFSSSPFHQTPAQLHPQPQRVHMFHSFEPRTSSPTPHTSSRKRTLTAESNTMFTFHSAPSSPNLGFSSFPSTSNLNHSSSPSSPSSSTSGQPSTKPVNITFVGADSKGSATTRRRATKEQLRVLNAVFEKTFFPSSGLRQKLALELDMTPRAIQIWFQNRRQGFRTKLKTDDSGGTPPKTISCAGNYESASMRRGIELDLERILGRPLKSYDDSFHIPEVEFHRMSSSQQTSSSLSFVPTPTSNPPTRHTITSNSDDTISHHSTEDDHFSYTGGEDNDSVTSSPRLPPITNLLPPLTMKTQASMAKLLSHRRAKSLDTFSTVFNVDHDEDHSGMKRNSVGNGNTLPGIKRLKFEESTQVHPVVQTPPATPPRQQH